MKLQNSQADLIEHYSISQTIALILKKWTIFILRANQVEDNSLDTIDQQLERIKQNMFANEKLKTGLKENSKPPKISFNTQINKDREKEQTPHFPKGPRTMNRISRLWRQDARAEMTAQRRFMQNRKNIEREQKIQELESKQHRSYLKS